MPWPMKPTPASSLSPRVAEKTDATPNSVRTEAAKRLQDLSLKQPPRTSPKRKLRFAFDDEFARNHLDKVTEESGDQGVAGSSLSPPKAAPGDAPVPTDRKRCNSRQLDVGLGSTKRKTSEILKLEGKLGVEEELAVDSDKGSPRYRSIGEFECALVLKSEGLVLQTSSTPDQKIELYLDDMELIMEPWQHECKFQLRYLPSASSKYAGATSYVFEAATVNAYKSWVNGIRGYGLTRSTSVDSFGNLPGNAAPRPHAVAGDLALGRESDEQYLNGLPAAVESFVLSAPPRIKHFVLVRHGHYVNAHTPHVPDAEQVLSQMGRQQAALTGKHLEALSNRAQSRNDLAVYHSDMARAVETAAIISADLGSCSVHSTPLLREGWPGQPYSTPRFTPVSVGATSARGASSRVQALNRIDTGRMDRAFEMLLSPEATPGNEDEEDGEESYRVIVCHANIIRFFLCRALGIDPVGTWGHFEINHCSVTRIDMYENRPLKVVAVNETGHLPPTLITSSEDHL